MSFWTPENLRRVLGGSWAARPKDPYRDIQASLPAPARRSVLVTDTRGSLEGRVFLALRGERFDAHAFVPQAVEAGSAVVVIDDASAAAQAQQAGVGAILVPHTGDALVRLAAAYRREALHGVRTVVVTGSNGKTTACRMLLAALGGVWEGVGNRASFNNRVGLPATVLSALPTDGFLVCEAGASGPGELAELSRTAAPDVVLITNIGRAHLEGFGGLDGVAREKATVAVGLRKGGTIVHCAGVPALEAALPAGFQRVLFGSGRGDVRVAHAAHAQAGLRVELASGLRFTLPMLGTHNAVNASGVVAVACALGVPDVFVAEGLAKTEPPPMRLAVQRLGLVTVVNDAYNANPDSMRSALAAFRDAFAGASRRVAVLGDMLELGGASDAEHAALAGPVLDAGAEVVVLVGGSVGPLAAALDGAGVSVHRAASAGAEDLARIARLIEPRDAVLLKGSRGVRLERVQAALAARFGARVSSDPAGRSGCAYR